MKKGRTINGPLVPTRFSRFLVRDDEIIGTVFSRVLDNNFCKMFAVATTRTSLK